MERAGTQRPFLLSLGRACFASWAVLTSPPSRVSLRALGPPPVPQLALAASVTRRAAPTLPFQSSYVASVNSSAVASGISSTFYIICLCFLTNQIYVTLVKIMSCIPVFYSCPGLLSPHELLGTARYAPQRDYGLPAISAVTLLCTFVHSMPQCLCGLQPEMCLFKQYVAR